MRIQVEPVSILICSIAVFLLLGLLTALPILVVLFLISVVAAASSAKCPELGISIWMLFLPFEQLLTEALGFGPFSLVSPAVVAGLGVHVMVLKKDLDLEIVVWLLGILSWFALSGVFTYPDLRQFMTYAVMFLLILTSFAALKRRPDAFRVICVGFFATGVIGLTYAVWTWDGVWRLNIDGNARVLSNVGGGLVLIGLAAWVTRYDSEGAFDVWHGRMTPRWIFLYLLLGLVLIVGPVSRGALMAVVFGAGGITMIALFSGVKLWSKLKMLSPALVMAVLAIIVISWFDRVVSRGQLARRIGAALEEPGGNLRWEIWMSALGGLEGVRWLTGVGLGRFRDFALDDYYAHSVYIDALVTAGVPGFVLVFCTVLAIGVVSARVNKYVAVGALVFVVVGFALHGSMSTKWYWFYAILFWTLCWARRRATGPKVFRSKALVGLSRKNSARVGTLAQGDTLIADRSAR